MDRKKKPLMLNQKNGAYIEVEDIPNFHSLSVRLSDGGRVAKKVEIDTKF